MTQQTTWAELSDRLEGLGLKLELHFEQARVDQPTQVLGRLRNDVEGAFEAAGAAVEDEAVRADVREVGRLLADAVSTALRVASDDLRDRANRS